MVKERARLAYEMRESGKLLREIGEALGGVSVTRARDLVRDWRIHLRRVEEGGIGVEAANAGVSTAAINALLCSGLRTKEEIIAAVRSRKKIYNLSKRRLAEIQSWLGIELASDTPRPASDAAIKAAITTLRRAGYTVEKK